jgi:hypothetical protein
LRGVRRGFWHGRCKKLAPLAAMIAAIVAEHVDRQAAAASGAISLMRGRYIPHVQCVQKATLASPYIAQASPLLATLFRTYRNYWISLRSDACAALPYDWMFLFVIHYHITIDVVAT